MSIKDFTATGKLNCLALNMSVHANSQMFVI